MKRILSTIALLLIATGIVHAEGPYYHTLGTRLNLPAYLALDTLGRIVSPDSITTFVKRQDALTPTAYRRWTSLAAACTPTGTMPTGAGWFDTVTTSSETYGSLTMNVWSDSLGPAGYSYNVEIRSWYKQGAVASQPFVKTHTVVLTAIDMINQLAYKLDSALVRRMSDSSIRTLTITADSLMKLINVYQGLNIVAVGNGSTTTNVVTTLTQSTTDFWKYKSLCMIRGTLVGQTREITGYNGTTKAFTTTAFTSAPTSGDTGILIPGAASGGSGGGTVTGYAVGQDPATLVLGAASSAWNTASTIGALLNWAGTSSNFLGRSDLGISADTVSDPSSTTSQFIGKVTVTGTDFWKDKAAVMTSGTLALCARRVTGYNYSTKTYTTDAFPSAPANGVTFIMVPIGSSQSIASVTVSGYTSGQAPEERLLVTPANKLTTDASGRINVGSWRDVAVAAPMTGGFPKVDIYGYRGFGPVAAPTLSGADYVPDIWNVRNNVSGRVAGNVGGIDPNGISEQTFQTGAISARAINPLAFDSGAFTTNFLDKLIARFVTTDTTGKGWTFSATKLGYLFSQTGAQQLDSAIMSRLLKRNWGVPAGVGSDSTTASQRTVTGFAFTLDTLQLKTLVAGVVGRLTWGIQNAGPNDSSTAAQRLISFAADVLVDLIWDELKSGHNISNSYGALLDARVSSVSGASGNGAYGWDVYLVDTSATPDSVINNAQVWVTNPAQNTQPYFAITDNTGKAHFQLNAGSWVTFTTEPGFAQAVRAFSMSASGRDTLKLYRGNTGRPLLALYSGSAAGVRYSDAKIIIDLWSVNDSTLIVGDTVVPSNGKGFVEVQTNSLGQATVPLYANASFTNDSTYYRFSAYSKKSGKITDRFRFRMPASVGTVWLKDVQRWADN